MSGIKDILVPIRQNELTIEKVTPYLPTILEQFELNAAQIRSDYEYYCLNHQIKTKTRRHGDTSINSVVIEPHLMAMVDWKVGYLHGFPMKYAQIEDTQSDDIKYLNKYMRDVHKRKVDSDVSTWVFATGVGYYFIQPREGKFDTEYQAPFDLWVRSADSCCKVKSAYNGNKELFDILFTTITEKGENGLDKEYTIMDIYFPNMFYEYRVENNYPRKFELMRSQPRYNTILPLTEKRLHNGIGLVAMLKSLQYALDLLSSGNLDNIQEVINCIFKYKGISLGDEGDDKTDFHRNVVSSGAIEIPFAQGMPFEPDLEVVKIDALNYADIEIFKNDLRRTAYETAGVPLATSDTNSGGTTKSGSEVANGYENAYNRALNHINDFIGADYELLQKIIYICSRNGKNKIDNLHASEIEIKYCLNLTDNILTKMQALVYAREIGMPYAMALEKTKTSNDSDAEGALWQEFAERQQEQQQQTEVGVAQLPTNSSQE